MACYAALALYQQPEKSKEIIIKKNPVITDLCDDILGLIQSQVLKNNILFLKLNEIEREQKKKYIYINFMFESIGYFSESYTLEITDYLKSDGQLEDLECECVNEFIFEEGVNKDNILEFTGRTIYSRVHEEDYSDGDSDDE